MRQSRLIGIAGVFLAAALSVPAWGTDPAQPKPHAARPGGLNYVEGQVSIDGEALGAGAIGYTELNPGQSLETGAGKAELLLTPGVFFRLGDNSSAVLISPSLTDTELRLDKGEATVEVQTTNQQLHTPYAQKGTQHTQSGAEINRDEVPVALQPYVQQYFEQVRKQAAPATPAAVKK